MRGFEGADIARKLDSEHRRTPHHRTPHRRPVALPRIIHTDLALTPGSRFGVYEVTALIGEGGMGQVYRARDTRLNRDVALKVLTDSFANDADRLARFTREAQTLASLNHPNIAAIHGFQEGPAEAGHYVGALVNGYWERPVTNGPLTGRWTAGSCSTTRTEGRRGLTCGPFL